MAQQRVGSKNVGAQIDLNDVSGKDKLTKLPTEKEAAELIKKSEDEEKLKALVKKFKIIFRRGVNK